MTETQEPHRSDLAGLAARGFGWITVSQVAVQALGFVTSIVVARFLGPREVGLAVEALVFGSLALVIVDFGFGTAIVQRPALSQEDRSTAFWAGMGLGLGLTLIGIGLSWPIAAVYGEPRVQPLFAVLSLSFLLTAPGIVQNALLTRELRFRSLELRTIVATAVSCGVGISLAIAGFDAWAIVVQSLVIAAVSTALLWRASSWRPSLTFSVASLRGMTGYAGNVFGTRVLSWAVVNLDNFLIGRFLGPTSLGLYSLAFTLMITPARRIGAPLNRILFPAFSRMDDRRRIARAWLRGVRMLALIVVPATLGLIAVAPDFVPFVFGERWEDAVPVIRILAPVGLIQALMYLNVGVLQAVDRTRTMFRFGLVLSIATVGAFAAGLPWGIEGVAVAYLIVTLILQPFNLRLTSAAVGTTVGDWLRSVRGVVQAGLGMLVVVLVTGELLLESDLAPGVRLAVLIATGAATYAPLVAWRDPDVRLELRELRRLLRSARERPPGSEPPIGTEPPGP